MRWLKYAVSIAAVVLLGIGGSYFIFQEEDNLIEIKKNVFDPGSKKAYLLSVEGEVTDLSNTFEVKKDDGTIITNNREGIISFQNTESVKRTIEQQTLYVPKGGEYELLLSDGSTVYLNSETQLIFPSSFEGETRQVELSGEAYFKVKKDAKPFIIKTSGLAIEVLGTSFNVNAYKSNSFINATLVEGSIQIRLPDNPEAILLKPENNLSLDKTTQELSIHNVNTNIYTAWVKGEFVFRNQSLRDIFSQLERWYDFVIIYRNPDIENMRFTGSAEKAKPLDFLLNQIQTVTDIKYKNEGDKIILYR